MNISRNDYSITYQNDALHSYMVLKLKPEDKLIDYQIKIIKDNPTQNLLALHRKQFDDEVFIHYDITSKITMEQFLIRRKLNRHEFLSVIKSLIKGLQTGRQYLLQGGKYILDIQHIYINPSSLEVSLAYMPLEISNDIREELRAFLIDLIVYKVVFERPEEGSFVYRLLNLLKSEIFSLEQLDKLVFGIAVEYEQPKESKANNQQSKELASIESFAALYGKDVLNEEGKQQYKSSSSKKKSYIAMLIQLLFLALTLLFMRLLFKQNHTLDMYTISGVLLLVLSVDFLVLKRLGIFEKRERESVAITRDSINLDKKQENRQKLRRERYSLEMDNLKPRVSVDMETSVLSEQGVSYAYLTGCQGNSQEKIVLNKPSFIIGRMKNQVDYVSQNNAIGKVHAEITNRSGVHYIRDLNSRNGTYINGERIVSNVEHVIKNNDRIAFANSEYKFIWGEGAS